MKIVSVRRIIRDEAPNREDQVSLEGQAKILPIDARRALAVAAQAPAKEREKKIREANEWVRARYPQYFND